MPNASERFSIRRRVKCIHVDEPVDIEAAERLFARLCARVLWADHVRRLSDGNEPQLPEESE